MKNRYEIKVLPIVFLLISWPVSTFAQMPTNNDTLGGLQITEIFFRLGQSKIEGDYMDNASGLRDIRKILSNTVDNPSVFIDSIRIRASASPDGNYADNKRLAEMRANSIKDFIVTEFPSVAVHIRISSFVEDWYGIQAFVVGARDIPNKEEVLSILYDPLDNRSTTSRLKALNSGVSYEYIAENILPLLRYGSSTIQLHWAEAMPVAENGSVFPVPEIAGEPSIPAEDYFPVAAYTPDDDPVGLVLKTNAVLLGALVANIGAEISWGNSFSVDLPLMYSPYTVSRTHRLRTLIVQPEFRYWLKKPLSGHFFGAHAHLGWFNVSLDEDNRYQDKNGNSPLWGFGISYGYALPFSKRWGAEFTLGGGYANIRYDTFYNIRDGAKHNTGTRNYWGITRVGISLTYRLK